MKWLLVSCFLLWARHGEGGALKCSPEDDACTIDLTDESIAQEIEKGRPFDASAGVAECLPGSEWESNCHKCHCSSEGAADCLKQPDCHSNNEEPIRCKPDSTFKNDCNTCRCLENGQALCTLRLCERLPDRRVVPTKASLPQGVDCAPGTSWQSQCNDCICSPDGRRHCTEKACPGQESESLLRCAPQSQWKSECNTCWCVSGRAMCTKMGCGSHPVQMHFDDEEKVSENASEVNKVNKPDASDFNNLPEVDASIKKLDDYSKDHNVGEEPGDENLTGVNLKDLDDFDQNDLDTPIQIPDEVLMEQAENSIPKINDGLELMEDYENKDNEEDLNEQDNPKGVDKDLEVSEGPYFDFNIQAGIHRIQKRSACKPNQEFQNDCNTCTCSASGQSYSCTQNECMDGGTEKEENDKGVDKEVEVFKEDEAFKSASKNATKKVCVENRMFIMNCNTCWCNEDGTSYFCTRKVCVQDSSEDPVVEEGKPENKTKSRKTRAAPQEAPKACQPGQEFRLDCNKCLCDNEGQDFSCTRMDCAALNSNNNGARRKRDVSQKVAADCVPGSVFDQGCNVCRCTVDGGHATCTLKRCAPSKENSTASATESSFRCNPGEQFKQSCNDCSCSADGKSVFCTLLVCDEDLTP